MGNTQSEYAEELINGFYTCAKEEHVNLVFLMRESMPHFHGRYVANMMGEDYNKQFGSIYEYVPYVKPDALIIAYGSLSIFRNSPQQREILNAYSGVPCLMFEYPSEDPRVPHLIADNYNGMRQCIQHLVVDHGYKKVAFVCGPKANHDSNERLRAYLDVMAENGLKVTDDMVVHGYFSENAYEQVEYLLDHNPGLQAIAFANDSMAKAGYRICTARNLVVGKDIAITGFDDIDLAKSMTPPLTSVAHSSFLFSYQALQDALMLCRGEKPAFERLPAIFHKRGSCGCVFNAVHVKKGGISLAGLEQLIEDRTVEIIDRLFTSYPYEKDKKQYLSLLQGYFLYIYEEVFVNEGRNFALSELNVYLKQMCSTRHVANQGMIDEVVALLREMMQYALNEEMRSLLGESIEVSQRYVHSFDIIKSEMECDSAGRRSWFLATFTRDLINLHQTQKQNMYTLMDRMKNMQVKSTYFFLFEDPVVRGEELSLARTDRMYLAAYYNEDETFCEEQENCPAVDKDKGISGFLQKENPHFYTTYALFSGNEHYGVMVCEAEQKDIYFLLSCSLQIGSLFHVLRIQAAEEEARQKLEESLELIKEQNSILSFISEYDSLTNLLNRRGFMEKSIHAIKESEGKRAYVLFADVDHLKEINDCFGHAAGDFAICTAADYLRNCLPEGAIAARIGGDEFVALVLTEQEDYSEQLTTAITRCAERFNESCGQPFYVEMSMGIYPFICTQEAELTDILGRSDTVLYEKKLHRRASIKKGL